MNVILAFGNYKNEMKFIAMKFDDLIHVKVWLLSMCKYDMVHNNHIEKYQSVFNNFINVEEEIIFKNDDFYWVNWINTLEFKYNDAIYDVINNDFDLMMWFNTSWILFYYNDNSNTYIGEYINTYIGEYINKFSMIKENNTKYLSLINYENINNKKWLSLVFDSIYDSMLKNKQ